MTTETILTERESRIATVLFEIMQPQIRKIIIQLINENNQTVQTITDRTIDFDIHEYTGEIEDIVSDWIR